MGTFTIDNKTMHFVDKGEGPVLVFGHSYLWDNAMWAPQVEALSQHYRCIVPDFWAHGLSDAAPEKTRSLRDYADDILALMDHLKIETFSVIGLSVGGMWGAELVLKAPARVQSLVLMDTFIGYEPEVARDKYFGMLDTITELQFVPEPLLDVIPPMFFSRNVQETSPELFAKFRQRLTELTGQKAVDMAAMGRMVFGRRDTFDEVEKLTLPTLVMVGAEDGPRPPLESQLMHDAIDGSQYTVIPAAGHISNLEQPELVTARLTEFLAEALN